jgi:hypothetical protein
VIISLNSVNQLVVLMVKCFLRGTDWIIKYYFDELRLQRANVRYVFMFMFMYVYDLLYLFILKYLKFAGTHVR